MDNTFVHWGVTIGEDNGWKIPLRFKTNQETKIRKTVLRTLVDKENARMFDLYSVSSL